MKRTELLEIMHASMEEALKACKSDNPIAAWNRFCALFYCAGSRRIGDRMEAEGRDRYTGMLLADMPPAPPPECKCDACWCLGCANFEDCAVDLPGIAPESQPGPCDGCVNGGPPYAPKPTPPPCGRYVKGE